MTQAFIRLPLMRRAGFDLRPDYVGLVVDKVLLEQVFLRVLRLSPINITTLHTYVFITDAI
jgi:hypothetical protein